MARHWQDAWNYANDVTDGTIPACKWVRLACQRFIDDLNHGHERGLVFNAARAQEILGYYDLTPHIKGEWAGKPIEPSDWQTFSLVNIFGWLRDDGLRRFRTVYIEVARKNGKSTFVAPLGLYMLKDDHEAGSEVYSAATSRDQARIVFDAARDMTRQSALRYHLQAFNHSLCHESSASSFKPLASDSDTLEGKNTHCAIIDELHAHKNRRVYDVLELSCAARSQPLLITITTAGDDRTGICYEVRSYLTKVLEGVFEDDSFFGVIYTLDDPDQWTDPGEWIKANPNLGVSVKVEDMERLCRKAQQTPSAANEFKRKRLDIWCNAESAYFDMEAWRRCPALATDNELKRLPCYFGLDLSSKLDITALVALWPDEDRRYHIRHHFWLPESVVDTDKSGKAHHIQTLYQAWADAGYLTLTPGQIIDYTLIREQIVTWARAYDVREIAYDPWGATQLATQLQDEDRLTLVEVHQSVKNFSEAMKEVEAVIIDGRLHHDHSEAMSWMMSNVTARVDRNDNVFPNKEHEDNKIDGPVALFLAMNRALIHQEANSVYDQEDLLAL
ncbi:MAG: terminase TerL endonuclease subunit [Candidatus Thiodiazotropha sp. 6PLUC6]